MRQGEAMRVSRRGAQILAVSLLIVPGGARANELLVMPYSCTMAGGQPVLSPAPEQSHRIVGQREQRRFSACSPVNPDMCRNWTVHRFDLDCDGTRVPWVSVVAATNEGSRRAWLLDGRLVMRMGPQWSLPPDDPCARQPDPSDRLASRRMRRYCTDVLAAAPAPVVEMPFGYAPMLGIDGFFVKAAPGLSGAPPTVSAAPAPGPSAGAGPLAELFPGSPPQPSFQRPDPPRAEMPGAELEPAQPAPRVAAPPPPAEPAAQPSPRIAAPPPPVPATRPPATEVPKVAPSESKAEAKAETKPPAPTPNLGPRIVNLNPPAPPSPAAGATATTAETRPPVANGAGASATAATGKAASAGTDVQQAAPPSAAPAPDSSTGASLFSVFRTTTTGVIVAFAGLALGLLTAFAVARRRERLSDTRRPPRDLSAVSLDGKRARPRPPAGKLRGGTLSASAAAVAAPGAPPVGPPPAQVAETGPVTEWGDRMPRTRAEALEVLGIGVAPTASDAALKKIVDGLRQSWHPDLATDETDRAVRELRSKQINAAWDLLRSQRAEV
jgi:hypothetical protein